MKNTKNFLALLITGLPGSGKSVVSEVLREFNIPVFIMGEIVFKETEKRYGSINSENVARTAKEIRTELGDEAVAILTLKEIKEKLRGSDREIIAIEGLRSRMEYEYFKRNMGLIKLIVVVASQEVRYKRIIERGRKDKERSLFDIFKRDLREISFGLTDLTPLADKVLFNEFKSLEKFRNEVKKEISNIVRGFQYDKDHH